MNIPADLKYTSTHEWVKIDGDKALVGLTDHAQDELGDLVFVNLPEEDDDVTQGDAVADVESVKAVSDIISPFTGKISKINEEILDTPELINEDPYANWLFEVSEISETEDLMDAAAYEKFCAEEE